jgi:glutaconate CoA-transferase subunit A
MVAATPRIITTSEAVSRVTEGATISIGGFINSSHPMHVVRELIRRRVRGLTVVGAASAGLEIDMLVAGGCVQRVVAPYVGAEGYAPVAPAFRAAAQKGQIDIWELDEGMYYAGLRAASQRLPFNPWRAGVGTSFPEVNADLKLFRDPIKNQLLLAIPAIDIQFAFIHAAISDAAGNVQHVGHGYGDRAQFYAADTTIVQVERIVSQEEIRSAPDRTSLPGVDGVISAPFGSHPFASPGHYREDAHHIRKYVEAATTWLKTGSRSNLDRYLEHYVFETGDDLAYLERVGLRALLELGEY